MSIRSSRSAGTRMSSVGSNTETLPLRSASNISIANDNNMMMSEGSQRSRKQQQTTTIRAAIPARSKSVSSTFTIVSDTSPILPDRAPESVAASSRGALKSSLLSSSDKATSSSGWRKKSASFRAAEGGRGDVLPSNTHSLDDEYFASTPAVDTAEGDDGTSSHKRTAFRAAERGRGDVLPSATASVSVVDDAVGTEGDPASTTGKATSSSGWRKKTSFRAAEGGRGGILPTDTHSLDDAYFASPSVDDAAEADDGTSSHKRTAFRAAERGRGDVLPSATASVTRSFDDIDRDKDLSSHHKRTPFRAAERGRGEVLPRKDQSAAAMAAAAAAKAQQQHQQLMAERAEERASRVSSSEPRGGRGALLPTRSNEGLMEAISSPGWGMKGNHSKMIGSSTFGMNRNRSHSSNNVNISRYMSRRNTTDTAELKTMTQSLRNRRSTVHLDDPDFSSPIVEEAPYHNGNGHNGSGERGDMNGMPRSQSVGSASNGYHHQHHQEYDTNGKDRGVKYTWSDTFGKHGGKVMRRTCSVSSVTGGDSGSDYFGLCAMLGLKRGQLLQAVLTLAVTFFVWDSYHLAMTATEQTLLVRKDQSKMMLHLKLLDEQSIHLHEAITQLTERGNDALSARAAAAGNAKRPQEKSDSIDEDLLKVQFGQLKQMDDELSHEVKSLQSKIQTTDRSNIVHAYGEGPVQVNLEIDFPGMMHTGSPHISILLWYETPHAAWTLLSQVRQGLWDGALFSLDKNLALVANQVRTPANADIEAKRLDFIEKGQKRHEAWTVGLTESEDGKPSFFINLQDNTNYHAHEVCIGKVIDGFDTLQRLTRTAREQTQADVDKGLGVRIKKATGSHLTRRDSAGLI